MFFSHLTINFHVGIIDERAAGDCVGTGAVAAVGPRTLSLTYLFVYLGCLERRSKFEELRSTVVIHVIIGARGRFGRHA